MSKAEGATKQRSKKGLLLIVAALLCSFCSSLFPANPAAAAPRDYEGLEYTLDGTALTLASPPGDGSSRFTAVTTFGQPPQTAYYGEKRFSVQGPPPLLAIQCPLDAVVLGAGDVAKYYRFEKGGGQGMDNFPGADGVAQGCKKVLKVSAQYNGISGKMKKADADTAPTDQETCEDNAIFGGFLCLILSAVGETLNAIYGRIFAYASFTLFNPVTGDAVGKHGLNQQNYDKLKAVWQTFARLASIILVAAFLFMIIATSASRS